jgi:PAS domain S-box-containing protein
MSIQSKTKKELVTEFRELQQENNSLKRLYRDISEFKKNKKALMASEIRYRSLFESAKDGILILDAETGKIVDVNPFLIELLGFSYDQFIEKSIWEIGVFKDILANHEKFAELKQNKYVRYTDLPLETKDGRTIHVEFVSNVYLADTQNVIQCNIRDITSRIFIENELIKAKERAEQSDNLKTAFLANMSHEIRTPMNGILGFANLLKTPNLSGEEQQDYIKIIERSGLRMLNIINDIISISKIESGLVELSITESNINKQIEYIYTFFKQEIADKDMQLTVNYPPSGMQTIIFTDREKLFSILTNLVKNAIKYSEKGTIEMGFYKKGEFLEFYVKDTGTGIDRARQKAIFERFIQADIADRMARQGAGLGLAISKAYVEMLGGKIWVESEKDIGSCFFFTIPCFLHSPKPARKTNDNIDCEADIPTNSLNILIVDDDETSDLLVGIMLEKISRKTLHAKDGFEAIELCRNNKDTDLILMDIKMPRMDGYEATRGIRQFNKEVIIIAQTAYGLAGDREKAIEAGCNEYLSKPIIKNKLVCLIKQYFYNNQGLKPDFA